MALAPQMPGGVSLSVKIGRTNTKEAITDLLFSKELKDDGSPKGIGGSLWRFYPAVGTASKQGDQSGIANEWRRGENFLLPNGEWD
jgi:hypothetical protein